MLEGRDGLALQQAYARSWRAHLLWDFLAAWQPALALRPLAQWNSFLSFQELLLFRLEQAGFLLSQKATSSEHAKPIKIST